jgi:predicted nucleic acid-binding protein
MIPTELIVDASVLVAAALADEPGHKEALAFLRASVAENIRRLVPAIMAAEVKGAIARRTGRAALAAQFFATLRARPDLVVVSVDAALGDEAGEVAALQGIKGCDAVYIALSRVLGIPLVTLDKVQKDRAPADVEVFTPEEALAKWWPA